MQYSKFEELHIGVKSYCNNALDNDSIKTIYKVDSVVFRIWPKEDYNYEDIVAYESIVSKMYVVQVVYSTNYSSEYSASTDIEFLGAFSDYKKLKNG